MYVPEAQDVWQTRLEPFFTVSVVKVAAVRRSDDGGPLVVEGEMGLRLHKIFVPDWSWP